MKLLKVGAGALNQTPLDWEHNTRNIINAIEAAHAQQISLLCLPELCITGYGCEDAFFAQNTVDQASNCLLEIVGHTQGILVTVGLPIRYNNRIVNVACLLGNGQIIGFIGKQHLPNDGIHYEERWFQPWAANQRADIQVGQATYPLGDWVFEVSGIRIGFEICQDAWIAGRPGRVLYKRGVDIILNPSASHFAFFKSEVRERLVVDASRAFGVSYIYTNLLGNEAGRVIYDGDAMVASNGVLLTSGPRLSYEDFVLVSAVVDVEATRLRQIQDRGPIARAVSEWLIKTNFDFPAVEPLIQKAELEAWERGGYLKEEEFSRAVALGLFDYLRKSRSQGYVLSLSGGADSSAIAALVFLMIRMAVENIGLDGVKQKLGYIRALQDCATSEAMVGQLLTVMYQGTENSSDDTFQSAKVLAGDIGARFLSIRIDGLVGTYRGLIEEQWGRRLTWETDDIALQNIQARVRAPSIWLLANLSNALLLTTSNRSEAAVGYATMDGDTAGSISPITGIDKHFLRSWLRWLETVGLNVKNAWVSPDRSGTVSQPTEANLIKVKGLRAVNQLQPSAELRPLDRKQVDEEDLMPYDVLNAIEEAAIRDKQSPLESLRIVRVRFADSYELAQLALWIERFFRLWSRNQWKRERYAPSFMLDDHNLDPRSWCRFPILSGGFERELDEMRTWLDAKSSGSKLG
ncbi:MAG: NAD(+) synthase [Stigonema ocellatum SAG 48.90 = DSM 106950]|uniref:NAD(+) synthase n=1 Tax=Spirosoma sp. TaxID=1899569 RepID=UPI002639CA0C|nr:NAD(+) synthase [Spirosoma sp.]MBR8838084.1 NAD(+) synthase [Stigonema ocellatum SAG 48.90 = DSM 106950]MCX6213902.1 NAD(+) synthase [Spirosoma sp.]